MNILFTLLATASLLGLCLANPAPLPNPIPQIQPTRTLTRTIIVSTTTTSFIPRTTTVYNTVTTGTCSSLQCFKACVTPTKTLYPPDLGWGSCNFTTTTCPTVLCFWQPFASSTSTHFCLPGRCSTVRTTDCEKIPTQTLVLPCNTECPAPCDLATETFAVACETNGLFR